MNTVFINYRSQGGAYAAALLDDRLSAALGSDSVFRASRSIRAGEDYELSILRAVGHCEVMLALIGPGWAENYTTNTASRHDDWVRREITEALKREIPVIPVLLAGASRLSEDDVPAELSRLARVQYLRFDYRNIDEDAARILAELGRVSDSLADRARFTPFSSTRTLVARTLTAIGGYVRARRKDGPLDPRP